MCVVEIFMNKSKRLLSLILTMTVFSLSEKALPPTIFSARA